MFTKACTGLYWLLWFMLVTLVDSYYTGTSMVLIVWLTNDSLAECFNSRLRSCTWNHKTWTRLCIDGSDGQESCSYTHTHTHTQIINILSQSDRQSDRQTDTVKGPDLCLPGWAAFPPPGWRRRSRWGRCRWWSSTRWLTDAQTETQSSPLRCLWSPGSTHRNPRWTSDQHWTKLWCHWIKLWCRWIKLI